MILQKLRHLNPKFGYAVCSNDECCNKYGYYKEIKAFCGKVCQSEFGRCNSITSSSVASYDPYFSSLEDNRKSI